MPVTRVLSAALAGLWTAACMAGQGDAAAAVNPFRGARERQAKWEFASKPAVERRGDAWAITFATAAECDVAVDIIDDKGRVIRHLAAGVLGANAPYPLAQGSLAQTLLWDGTDDRGRRLSAEELRACGAAARVSLGLEARFEAAERQFLFTRPKALAVDERGRLYYATFDGIVSGSVHVFDRKGKYLRTIFPPPSIVPPEKLSMVTWNRSGWGESIPRRHRWGGGWDFTLDNINDFLGKMQNHAAAVTPDGRLALLCGYRYGVPMARLLFLDTALGAAPAGSVAGLGKLSSAGVAISPDGKWMYFAGMARRHGGGAPSHAIMRAPVDNPQALEKFAGEIDESGTDNTRLDSPEHVAFDAEGRVYIDDTGNRRVQVFSPEGRYLRTIPDVTMAALHPRTGAMYAVKKAAKWPHAPVVVRMGGGGAGGEASELSIWAPGAESCEEAMIALDAAADPPALWFAGWYRNKKGPPARVVRIEDRDGKLAEVADAMSANGLSEKTGEGDSSLSSHQSYLDADRAAGKCVFGAVVGPDGLYYQRLTSEGADSTWIVRTDPATGRYVPFEKNTAQARVRWGKDLLVHEGKPVMGLVLKHGGGGPHEFQNPFTVAPYGDIYAPCYARAAVDEMLKAGITPPVKPGVCCDNLWVFAPDGEIKAVSALPGLTISDGVRVGRAGALYVVLGLKPVGQKTPEGLSPDSTFDETRWGSLVKFNSVRGRFPVGRIVGWWENADAENPTHRLERRLVRVDSAHWSYGGVSPVSAHYLSCVCLKSSFDLDEYERAWVCAAQTCTINVLDANGNIVARLGGYGNNDSRGDDSAVIDPQTGELRARRPDDPPQLKSPLRPLAFSLPRSVAVSGRTMWVHDVGQRALLRARLMYRVEQTAALP